MLGLAEGSFLKKGYTVILVPRCDALATKPVKTAYSATAGTAFVIYDKVRVPIANTLGKEGEGMKVSTAYLNLREETPIQFIGYSK